MPEFTGGQGVAAIDRWVEGCPTGLALVVPVLTSEKQQLVRICVCQARNMLNQFSQNDSLRRRGPSKLVGSFDVSQVRKSDQAWSRACRVRLLVKERLKCCTLWDQFGRESLFTDLGKGLRFNR